MKRKKTSPAAGGRPASRAMKGSATRKGAGPTKKKLHPRSKRKLVPVSMAVAFSKVRPDTQIWDVMSILSNGSRWVSMPVLSKGSGSLNIHSVVAEIRGRFHWVIENRKVRQNLTWDSDYRLVEPQP